jgi:hypothetical protein
MELHAAVLNLHGSHKKLFQSLLGSVHMFLGGFRKAISSFLAAK